MSLVGVAVTFVLGICFIKCEIILRPSNTEAVIGDQVELKCTTNVLDNEYPVEWHHIPLHSGSEIVYKQDVSVGRCRDGKCYVIPKRGTGEYNLIITNVALSDAGRYTCQDPQTSIHAELVVLGSYLSPQSCTAKIPPDGAVGLNSCGLVPDSITLSCNTSYCGNLVPVMEWMSAEDEVVTSGVSRTTDGDVSVSTLVARADQVRSASFTCRIKYFDSDLQSNQRWTHSFSILSNQTRIVVVTSCETKQLQCAIPTKHSCSYSWIYTSDSSAKRYAGAALGVSAELSNGLYICEAVCTVRGKTCTLFPLQAELKCPNSGGLDVTGGVIAAIVVTVIGVAIVAAIVIFLIVCYKEKVKASSPCFKQKSEFGSEKSTGVQQQSGPVATHPLIVEQHPKPHPDGDVQTNPPKDIPETEHLRSAGDGNEDSTNGCMEEVPHTEEQPYMNTNPGNQSSLRPEHSHESDPDMTNFVFVDITEDAIVEHTEHRFPGK